MHGGGGEMIAAIQGDARRKVRLLHLLRAQIAILLLTLPESRSEDRLNARPR
jgi:hypothetical protein